VELEAELVTPLEELVVLVDIVKKLVLKVVSVVLAVEIEGVPAELSRSMGFMVTVISP
jgi:hypothetical protein